MNQFLRKIENSFRAAMRGEESVDTLIWWWGVVSYMVSYFIIDRIIKISSFKSIDVILSFLMVVYFAWHIYALKKCAPKKPQMTKEEKERMQEEARRDRGKKFMRKLFLQEPITKWDPVFITMVVDVFCIANFLSYVIK